MQAENVAPCTQLAEWVEAVEVANAQIETTNPHPAAKRRAVSTPIGALNQSEAGDRKRQLVGSFTFLFFCTLGK